MCALSTGWRFLTDIWVLPRGRPLSRATSVHCANQFGDNHENIDLGTGQHYKKKMKKKDQDKEKDKEMEKENEKERD